MRRKKFNWQAVWVIFIGIIMVGSTIGFIVGPYGMGGDTSGTTMKVNGYKIEATPTGYEATVNKARIAFTYSPITANRTFIPPAALASLKNAQAIYFTSNFSSPAAQTIAAQQYNLARILTEEYGPQVVIVFVQEAAGRPPIDCDNASSLAPVVEFRDADTTTALYAANCLVLQAATPTAYIELRDRVVYGLFGIL